MPIPTNDQVERADKLDAALMELLNLRIEDSDRKDHIDIATELLQRYAQSFALAREVLGDHLDPEGLDSAVRFVIETHLKIAALKAI